jgi:hypothetical protein
MALAGDRDSAPALEATLTEHLDRDALARRSVILRLPGMDRVATRRDVSFRASSGAELLMDVYYPLPSRQRPPLVLLPMAYPDPEARARAFGPLTSWARLLAATGLAAAVYGTEAPADDIHAVLRHVRVHAKDLGIDATRIALLASSGNGTVALATLMRDARIGCAAFLYAYTMDLEGTTAVADASTRFGFVDACAGRSADDLPSDTPMLFVRAARDQFPGVNAALDHLVRHAVERHLPIGFINHATGGHGFDIHDPSVQSRRVIEQLLAFLRLHLAPDETITGAS